MKIVNIEKNLKTGEHDQLWKGKPVKLNIQPKIDGFTLLYEIECDEQPFGDMGPTIQHRHSLCGVGVKFKWWHKMLGITEEQRIETGIKKLKKRWAYMVSHTKKFDDIREKYGISNEDIPTGG